MQKRKLLFWFNYWEFDIFAKPVKFFSLEEAKAFLDQYRNKLTATSLSSAVQKDLGEFAKLRRMVLDSNKTTAEKDVLLDRIDNAQYKLASKFLSFTGETRPQ